MRLRPRPLFAVALALGALLALGGGAALLQEAAGSQRVFLPAIFRVLAPPQPTPTSLVVAPPAPPPATAAPEPTAVVGAPTPTATPEPTAVVGAPKPTPTSVVVAPPAPPPATATPEPTAAVRAPAPAVTPTPVPAGVPLRTSPTALGVAVGSTATFEIVLDGGSQAFDAVQVYLTFDPRLVEVVDADSARAGVQVTPGTAFSDVLLNSADNAAGRVQFAAGRSIAQVPPSGTLVLATVELRGKAEGASPLAFEPNSSAAFAGRRIALQPVPGSVTVRAP